MKEMRIKKWFLDKTSETANKYNTYIDVTDASRDSKTRCITADADGFVEVIAEVISESEKAIQVVLKTGEVVGSTKGWKTWIPKSVIA